MRMTDANVNGPPPWQGGGPSRRSTGQAVYAKSSVLLRHQAPGNPAGGLPLFRSGLERLWLSLSWERAAHGG